MLNSKKCKEQAEFKLYLWGRSFDPCTCGYPHRCVEMFHFLAHILPVFCQVAVFSPHPRHPSLAWGWEHYFPYSCVHPVSTVAEMSLTSDWWLTLITLHLIGWMAWACCDHAVNSCQHPLLADVSWLFPVLCKMQVSALLWTVAMSWACEDWVRHKHGESKSKPGHSNSSLFI